MLTPWKKSYDKPRQCIQKQRHHFADKVSYSQTCGFSGSHEWMWELDHKEGWMPKNWCFWAMVLEKALGSPLECKEIKPVNPKGNQSWIFIRRADSEVKLQYFGHLMQRANSFEKALMLGKIEAGGGGDDRGWDGWMALLTRGTWVWVSSRRWWRTGKPGVLQSMGPQRVGHDWVSEQNEFAKFSLLYGNCCFYLFIFFYCKTLLKFWMQQFFFLIIINR